MSYYPIPGRGDYGVYRGRGDFLGFLKGVGRTALGFATGGVVGATRAAASSVFGGSRPPMATTVSVQNPFGLGGFSATRMPVGAHASPQEIAGAFRKPRRRMNPANPKALRRSLRRIEGFGALAARAASDVARANRTLNKIPRKATKKRR